MINTLWSFLLLLGIGYSLITGQAGQVTTAILEGASSGIQLCITMFGVIALWSGVMEIGERAGLVEMMAGKMKPLLHILFPRIPDGHLALRYIATNFVANILGLGWAATPAGLAAMEELAKLEEERRETEARERVGSEKLSGKQFVSGQPGRERSGGGQSDAASGVRRVRTMPKGVANNEMCTFLILNVSSLQLIPVNMIAYRSQYGSLSPTAIVGPGIVATTVSTAAAILFCKVMDRK